MASLGVRLGGGNRLIGGRRQLDNQDVVASSVAVRKKNVVCMRRRTMRISMSMKAAEAKGKPVVYEKMEKEKAVVYKKVDEWMRDSVVEIVKNLREAPLLVHVYPRKDGETRTTTELKTEKAVEEENWPVIMDKWKTKEAPVPEGLIFVEQLVEEEEEKEGITRAWGIVVQGKGCDCGPVCYLLKTSQGGGSSGSGFGLCCTHFCLMRVKSFRETASSQLKNCWLLQSLSS